MTRTVDYNNTSMPLVTHSLYMKVINANNELNENSGIHNETNQTPGPVGQQGARYFTQECSNTFQVWSDTSNYQYYTFAHNEVNNFTICSYYYYYYYYYYNRLTTTWTLSGTIRVSRYQKGKTRKENHLDLLEQETVSGSGIS